MMAHLERLKQSSQAVIEEYFSCLRLAEQRREQETAAVVKIQAHARGFLVRRRIARLSQTALVLQKHWRGYTGRLRSRLAWEEHSKKLRQAYFNAKATTIQRHWRGYYSRRYVHDFYARKAYLQAVKLKNEAVRMEINEEAMRSMQLQKELADSAARKVFVDKVSKLHHLVSTTSQPGIFMSPYALASGQVPVVLGAPVEEHLKSTAKAQIKAQKLPPLSKRGSPPYPPVVVHDNRVMPARLTLRQAADYTAVHDAAVLEEKVHRGEMLTKHPQAFASSLSKPYQPTLDTQTNRNLEKYIDPFDPTVGGRGPRFTPDQAKISQAAFNSYLLKQQPFFDEHYVEGY